MNEQKYMKEIKIKKCELCSTEFEVNANNKRSNKKRYCSRNCAITSNGLRNKGKKHTDDFKLLMSNKYSGENNPFFGKKHSDESLRKMSISSQWKEDKFKFCNMTKKEKEIFDGIMISDGCLNSSRISTRLTLGFKYLETIDRIVKDLPSVKFLKPWEYRRNSEVSNKIYINFFTKSMSYRDLFYERNRWYRNNKKIIPKDIELTPLTCYWWFVCDGYISNKNVYLCTECFDEDDLNDIKKIFTDHNFFISIRKNKRIFFNKKQSIEFLNWISKDIDIQKEYEYKWKILN